MEPGNEVDFELAVYTPPSGSEVDFELAVEPPPSPLLAFGISGKLGKPEWPDPAGVYGIYQMRMTKRGKRPIKMKFYTPTNPNSEAQIANRQKFANAMSAWVALTSEEKQAYNQRAKRRQMNGWGLFIREYYQFN